VTWQRDGVRYHKAQSRGGRWGEPKVHVEYYHTGIKDWWPVCSRQESTGFGYGWQEVPDDEVVTCKLCLRVQDRWTKKATHG
jgi:hypothetical protein